MSKLQKLALIVTGLMAMTLISTTAVVAQDNCLDLGNGQGLCFANGAFYVTGAEDPSDMDPVQPVEPVQPIADNTDCMDVQYCDNPQPQIRHASLYLETGVPDPYSEDVNNHTKLWNFRVVDGMTAIVGGFTVDGTSDGVYRAIQGPGRVNTKVTDGFVEVIRSDWANAQFCERVRQAKNEGWAHQHIRPLDGWTSC